MPTSRCLAKLALSFVLLSSGSAWGFPIILNNTGGAAPGSPAGNAFAAAAARYESLFTDPINVYINIAFNNTLSPGILGSTSVSVVGLPYSSVRGALVADQNPWSAVDALATAHLPASPALQFLTNLANGSVSLDNNASANNLGLAVAQANARALGRFSATGSAPDASITLSSSFSWDFDPSDGITTGSYDFVGVATHEIGHVLGFASGVDVVDLFTGLPPKAVLPPPITTLDDVAIFYPLDLFRYTAQSVAAGPGVLGLTTGGTPFFSLDGGSTSLATFSTGSFQGDGRQASHWKDGQGWGIMDPTFAPGELGVLTQLDINAFDAIGYNLPDPAPELNLGSATLPLTLMLVGFVTLFERRQSTQKAAYPR